MPTFPTRTEPWVPKFDAQFIEPLIVTMRELTWRDQDEALAWASPDRVLRRFAKTSVILARREKAFYVQRATVFPLLVIAPGQTTPPESKDGGYVADELNQISVEICAWGKDADELTIDIMRYVKAADFIWRSASFADLTWNLKPNHFSKVETDVTLHQYSVIAEDGPNSYLHTASLNLTATFSEG